MGFGYFFADLTKMSKWIFQDTEDSNFYYDLEPKNEQYLVHLISNITGVSNSQVEIYVNEIKENVRVRESIEKSLIESGYPQEIQVRFGRRIGWYALIRILKPKVVVETGVDHGIGLSVICEALQLNRAEGYNGRYFGTDINPSAGKLTSPEYFDYSTILYGDSITSLSNLDETIDFFINDSDHSENYEMKEYEVIQEKLSKNAIILGDNSHVTDKLSIFSKLNNRRFYFFKEEPLNHWYPGAGIGISLHSTKNEISS
jgi:predicted O-methyltransferase YrrM